MNMWSQPLTRENIDAFFHMFAPPAYRTTYRILGDTTRTENALTEAFLEVYHRRNSDDAGDLVFLFSDILQRRVETLAAAYPISAAAQVTNRTLDEFTENSILSELHHRIDSKPYKILEIFTSTAAARTSAHADPILGQIQKTGISLFLVLQLIIVAIIIFAITFTSAKTVFGIDDIAPQSPERSELSIEDLLVPVLNYLPLKISAEAGDTVPAAEITPSPESTALNSMAPTGEPALDTQAGAVTEQTASSEPVASATRG